MIQYYLVVKKNKIDVWGGDSKNAGFLLTIGGVILPLGNRSPQNVAKENIKRF